MAKANIVEKHSLTVQGVVIIRDGKVLLDVEDIGGTLTGIIFLYC